MAKKGKGSKKKQNKEDKKDSLPEVDKEYYEIQISDLNKKLTRLKQRCGELEKENAEVTKNYKTLDEDRADIIAYLKRSITQKHEEIQDVTQRLQALQSAKDTEKDKYEEQIGTMEKDYKSMHDTFTAEVKLLTGQLSSLESFKNNREAMVKRLISLEEELKKKDEHHALALRNNENKFILMKEKLSGYVEEKLLQLSLDLQKQTQNRISETTHNVVKENIAVNNELNLIIGSWQKVFDENERLKQYNKSLKQNLEITSELKEKSMEKNLIQSQVLERLTYEHQKMLDKYATIYYFEQCNEQLKTETDKCMKEMNFAKNKAQQLEVMYHAATVELQKLKLDFKNLKTHNYKLEDTIKDAVKIIKDVIGLQSTETADKTFESEFTARRQLLNTLLGLFNNSGLFQTDEPSDEENIGSQDSILAEDWIKKSPGLSNCPYIKRL